MITIYQKIVSAGYDTLDPTPFIYIELPDLEIFMGTYYVRVAFQCKQYMNQRGLKFVRFESDYDDIKKIYIITPRHFLVNNIPPFFKFEDSSVVKACIGI